MTSFFLIEESMTVAYAGKLFGVLQGVRTHCRPPQLDLSHNRATELHGAGQA